MKGAGPALGSASEQSRGTLTRPDTEPVSSGMGPSKAKQGRVSALGHPGSAWVAQVVTQWQHAHGHACRLRFLGYLWRSVIIVALQRQLRRC